MQVDSFCSLDQEFPLPGWAFQVSSCRQSDGLQMADAVGVLPQGHSTRPLLHHCFSASLETSPVFPSSSHLTGCSTDGSQGDNYGRFIRMGRASVDRQCVSVLILLISLGNWPISWCDTTFHQSCETYICVSNEWLCLCVTVFRFMQLW